MKIVAVRIGNRYGPEYETYLESKLPEYEFVWIREPMADNIKLQWNKMYGMTLNIDEPICVIDIDILLINEVVCDALIEISVDNPVDKEVTPVDVDVDKVVILLVNEVS